MHAVHGCCGDNEEKGAIVFEKKKGCTADVVLDVLYVVYLEWVTVRDCTSD